MKTLDLNQNLNFQKCRELFHHLILTLIRIKFKPQYLSCNHQYHNELFLPMRLGLEKRLKLDLFYLNIFCGENPVSSLFVLKQWERELEDKFDISTRIMDRKIYDYFRGEHKDPFNFSGAIICSYNFASSFKTEIHGQNFDLAVIDEANKLCNLYKGKTKIADNLREAFYNTKKLLLTASQFKTH